MQTAIQDYFNGLCCPEPTPYNFDITANWATGDTSYPVTDQTSFEAFLANRSYEETNDITSISITNFSLVGNRLQCNLTANGTILDLTDLGVTEVSSIEGISGLEKVYLGFNQITNFNPSLLPNSLQVLGLDNNLITTFNPTLPLPSALIELFLRFNQIVTFNPTLPLPSSLKRLSLLNNLMTTAGYAASETWANGVHTAPSGGTVNLNNNIDSVSGTNLETILTSKGWVVST